MTGSSFRTKQPKTIRTGYLITLDQKHQEFVSAFASNTKYVIPALRAEQDSIERNLRTCVGKEVSMRQLHEWNQRLIEIKTKINTLEKQKRDYYLDHSECLHDYFAAKKSIVLDTKQTNAIPPADSKTRLLHDMFRAAAIAPTTQSAAAVAYPVLGQKRKWPGNNAPTTTPTTTKKEENAKEEEDKTDTAPNEDEEEPNAAKRQHTERRESTTALAHRYLSRVDTKFIDIDVMVRPVDVCKRCAHGEMQFADDEGISVCASCGGAVPVLTDLDRPTYRDIPADMCPSTYKRGLHFKDVMYQFQGKETTTISEHVFARISMQFKKERVRIPQDITRVRTKEVLRTLQYPKLYDHVVYIMAKYGVPPPRFSTELEETMMNLFMNIQAPYARHHPNGRTHFLNYSYVLYKFCELLGQTQYLPMIILLKRDIIIKLDATWKLICEDLNYPFFPTV